MFVPHQLLYFTGLRCCCVCPTSIALFDRFKMLCLYTTIVWFHRLKMLLCLSHTNCFISQVEDIVVFFPHQLLYVKGLRCCVFVPHQLLYFTGLRCCCVCTEVLFDFTGLRCCCVSTQVLFDFTGLRCCCVCPTPIALFHRFKMLLCLSHTNCFISQV